MQTSAANQTPVAFPWTNTRVLEDSLRNGELSLASAITQFGSLVKEILRILGENAEEQMQANMHRKLKLDKMDKVISDLTDRCQGMQQALLYKEEKYDSKCREVERYKVICEMSANAVEEDRRSSQMATYYLGGPVKRKRKEDDSMSVASENKFREQLAIIGGMNLSGPKVNSGPVPLNKLHRQIDPSADVDRYKRAKLSLVGQSNEVLSSSKNAVDKMKQKFTEKDLHRQVAGGSWTRSSSRRKKEWPF